MAQVAATLSFQALPHWLEAQGRLRQEDQLLLVAVEAVDLVGLWAGAAVVAQALVVKAALAVLVTHPQQAAAAEELAQLEATEPAALLAVTVAQALRPAYLALLLLMAAAVAAVVLRLVEMAAVVVAALAVRDWLWVRLEL